MKFWRIFRPFYKYLDWRPDKSQKEIHSYWKNPGDAGNKPECYLETPETLARSEYLVNLVKNTGGKNDSILEIGCNVGRNLNCLRKNGYVRLSGIEISENAVKYMKDHYPELYDSVTIHNVAIENVIKKFNDLEYDVVFTMAVLEHLHWDSEWVMKEIARISKKAIITIEDEKTMGWKHFGRNYKNIFEEYGFKQVLEDTNIADLDDCTIARILIRA
ncbi:MAG TPA: class I SAM-dependent methyltransferase [candidate division Zixibacteria bacterium]|jgi:2-polyprenyl-3-methyl-5-hydroxy-6-metoxy-1,4-benzoquinol methylase|nr:class I SAM-dependent methyltransferase [candidate division Zixibacteria bacterium]